MKRIAWKSKGAIVAAVGMAAIGVLGSLLTGCANTHPSSSLTTCHWPPILGRPPMPNPQRLTTTLSFGFNHVRLYPPPPRLKPKVSATRAWDAPKDLRKEATYKLVLAEWNSNNPVTPGTSPTDRLLVWVIMGRHVEVGAVVGSNTISAPRCVYESAMWPVDATTGLAFGELTFPSSGPVVTH
jgi:hypothetical protein